MNISFIATVYNEEENIDSFLTSLLKQSKKPHQIIIVDGGSSDATFLKIKSYAGLFNKNQVKFEYYVKKGNRSVGRNFAIKKASGDLILCSDAGNILDKNWTYEIIKPFKKKNIDVAAGYYRGKANNIFQKCLIPYVLIMPDKLKNDFIPATRSIAFKKNIWKKIGGFDERYSHNEDYVFSRNLVKNKARIEVVKKAIVNWLPRKNLKAAAYMFYRFAKGDSEAKIIRDKVLMLFARYFLVFYLSFLFILYKFYAGFALLLAGFLFYIAWAIWKNYKYVDNRLAYFYLPLLQFTADFTVIFGTLAGILNLFKLSKCISYIKKNKYLFFVICGYLLIGFYFLRWGAPSQLHPFPYHMDEWHQLNAVRATFAYGTPNTEGAANGTMFQFLLSGFWLIPFNIAGWINLEVIEISGFINRMRIFDLLRVNTLIFGVLSIFTIYKIAEILKASKKIAITLFTFTPIWILLSGYFKYDIALIFWILLSILLMINYSYQKNTRNFIIAGIACGIAVAVKISALPLLPAYIFSFLLFNVWYKKLYVLFLGLLGFAATVVLFGIPDTVFGRGNILTYLYENIITSPSLTTNINLPLSPHLYLLTRHYPLVFGYGIGVLFIFSMAYWLLFFIKNGFKKNKTELLIIFSTIFFVISLVPLNIQALGNRGLVLLPFAAIVISFTFKEGLFKNKAFYTLIIVSAVGIQLFQVFSWLSLKYFASPQDAASGWVIKNLPENSRIGIENIPIYQMLPDIVQREYYYDLYGKDIDTVFEYEIVDADTKNLPKYVVITNDEVDKGAHKVSPKKDLLERLNEEHYVRKIIAEPNIFLYMLFGNELDYYYSGVLVAVPLSIALYEKYPTMQSEVLEAEK